MRFAKLLDFPNEFTFRIIAYAKDTIVQDCSDVLQGIFGEIKNTGFEPSSSGRFYRIHITVIAKTASDLYAGYKILNTVDGIKMVL